MSKAPVAIAVGDEVTKMIWIPPGEFLERPQHLVRISRGFWLGETPVTQALWETVMGKNPSRFRGDDHPVEQISWNDCQEFLKGLSEKAPGGWRLPTEAEWEYACEAGTASSLHSLRDEDLDAISWYWKNSQNMTHPVGEKRANAWGLHDMLGNVWEWCEDKHGDGPSRVIRGGSWYSTTGGVRVASRYWIAPDARYDDLGFRLALSEGDTREDL
jgi:formylglycine-generating enzyme required for sulfatase activity